MGEETINGDPFFILISEKEWLTILKSYIKLASDLQNTELINFYEGLLKYYENLKKKDYVLEFYYAPYRGLIGIFVRTKEEYQIYRKKLLEYGIY